MCWGNSKGGSMCPPCIINRNVCNGRPSCGPLINQTNNMLFIVRTETQIFCVSTIVFKYNSWLVLLICKNILIYLFLNILQPNKMFKTETTIDYQIHVDIEIYFVVSIDKSCTRESNLLGRFFSTIF